MPTPRSAWNPVTPLAAVAALSLAVLLTPAEQHAGWLALIVLLLSPVAAFLAIRALRSTLDRAAPVAAGSAPEPRERTLSLALRALLGAFAFLVPLAALVAEVGAQQGVLTEGQRALTLALPFALVLLGVQLFRDLRAARAERAAPSAAGADTAAAAPPARTRASVTGVPALDDRIGRRPRAAPRITWVLAFASAGAWVASQVVHREPILALLMKDDERVRAGEVWRVFTATFFHGSIPALLVNLAAFFAVGPLLELLLGAPRLVFVFVVGGVAACIASFALSAGTYLGAAGAVAAVAGGLLALGARRGLPLPPPTRRRCLLHGAVALAIVTVGAARLPEVDLAAVGGGLLLGVLAGLAFDPPEDARAAMAAVAAAGQ